MADYGGLEGGEQLLGHRTPVYDRLQLEHWLV